MISEIKTKKNCKISVKLITQEQQPTNGLSDSSENFRADKSKSYENFCHPSDLF